jgi:Peptidase A4 family
MSRQITRSPLVSLTRIAAVAIAASLVGTAAMSIGPRVVPTGAAAANTPAATVSDPTHAGTTSRSWVGYEEQDSTYTSVSASWTQPSIQTSTSKRVAVFWVGLDGANSDTVEQCGTRAESENGKTSYYAWFEMYPAAWVDFHSAPVHPGDHIEASAAYSQGLYTLTVADHTQGWTRTTRKPAADLTRSSAEIIAEAPTIDGSEGPLANFSPVTFSNIRINGAPVSNPVPVTMISASGRTAASVCAFTGGAFTVTPQR